MWIRVALDKSAIKQGTQGNPYIDGSLMEEFYFDENIAKKLEADGFLTAMWKECDAVFDWGDCDFFYPDKCRTMLNWLNRKLSGQAEGELRQIYEKMLDYAQKAIKHDTGLYFDF